jgi:hypothetical protein
MLPGQAKYGDEEEREVRQELKKDEERQKSYSKEDEEKVKEEMDKPAVDKKQPERSAAP